MRFKHPRNADKIKAFCLALVLFALSSLALARISGISQDGPRQVVNLKRAWAKNHFIKNENGKNLIFFMGDSKIVAGLVPEVFDQATNGKTHSYNMALPGLPLAPHYFLLLDYLKTNPPPNFILLKLSKGGWDYFHFPEYSIQGAGLLEVLEYRRVSGNNKLLINYFLSPRLNWPFVKRFLIGKLYTFLPHDLRQQIRRAYQENQAGWEHYEHDWEYFFEVQFVRPAGRARERRQFVSEHRGYYDFRENAAVGGALPQAYVYVKKGEWAEGGADVEDPFVEKFFQLTQSRGIKVMLINDYVLASEEMEPTPEYWKDIAGRYGHVMFPEEVRSPKILDNQLFSDPLHVSRKGAELFSRYIASIFLRSALPKS